MSKKVVLAGACRTAIGTMGGSLSTTPAPVLGSIVIKSGGSCLHGLCNPGRSWTERCTSGFY